MVRGHSRGSFKGNSEGVIQGGHFQECRSKGHSGEGRLRGLFRRESLDASFIVKVKCPFASRIKTILVQSEVKLRM